MGGEWIFDVKPDKDFCVQRWQQKLLQLRGVYQSVRGLESETSVKFVQGSAVPADNVFASFTYKCKRHGDGCGAWYLLWNPWQSGPENETHARCAPHNFKRYSYEIQRNLSSLFPTAIHIEWGDGLDGYSGRLMRSKGRQDAMDKAFSRAGLPANSSPSRSL